MNTISLQGPLAVLEVLIGSHNLTQQMEFAQLQIWVLKFPFLSDKSTILSKVKNELQPQL